MKPSRSYFTKAHSLDKVPTLKLKRKNYKGLPGLAVPVPGKGVMVANQAWLAKQAGRSKGGLAIAEAGTAHRWTTETARKAALRRWKTRTKMSKRLGIRLGNRIKNRSPVKRAPLRHLFSRCEPVQGVWFDASLQIWVFNGRKISERRALQRLGYLPATNKGWVPEAEQLSVTMGWRNPDGSIPELPHCFQPLASNVQKSDAQETV